MSHSANHASAALLVALTAVACQPPVRVQRVRPVADGADADAPRANGALCDAGSECQSGFCADGVCCAEACDGLCEACDASGSCGVATDDEACGEVDCDGLDTTCRDYDDLTARCAARGACHPANGAACTVFLDADTSVGCDDGNAGTAPDQCDGAGTCAGRPVVLAKAGAFQITTDPIGTVVPVTGVGFRPKVLFLWWSGRVVDPTTVTTSRGRQHNRRGFAFSTGPGACRLVTNFAEDNSNPADADRMYRADGCVAMLTTGGGLDGLAELASFDEDGFALQIAYDAFSLNITVTYLALGGEAIAEAAVGTFASITGVPSGTQDVTDVGFQPDALFFLSGAGVDPPPHGSSSASLSLGAATGPAVEQNALSVVAVPNGANPPTSRGYGLVGEALASGNGWLSLDERGRLGGFLPQGFTIDWLEADPDEAWVYFYLAIRGGAPHLSSLMTLTDTTTDAVMTVGYKPAGALFVSRGEDEDSPDSSSSRDYWSVGAFASPPTEQWLQGSYHAALSAGDPMPDSRASTVLSAENVYYRLTDGGGLDASMALISVDPTGFTCRMTDADSTRPRLVWFVTFGPAVQ